MPMKIQPPERQRCQGMKGWTLRALARQLGRDQEAKLLQEILDQKEQTAARLTELAGDGIDQKAERAPAGNGRDRRGRTARMGPGEQELARVVEQRT